MDISPPKGVKDALQKYYGELLRASSAAETDIEDLAKELTDVTVNRAVIDIVKKQEHPENLTDADIKTLFESLPPEVLMKAVFDAAQVVIVEYLKQIMPKMGEEEKKTFLAFLEKTTKRSVN